MQLFGFGPVSPAGYGIGYIIKDNGIQFCISSKHRQTARFVLTLQKFMRGIKELLHEEAGAKVTDFKTQADAAAATSDAANSSSAEDGGVYDFFGVGSAEGYRANQETLPGDSDGVSSNVLFGEAEPAASRYLARQATPVRLAFPESRE